MCILKMYSLTLKYLLTPMKKLSSENPNTLMAYNKFYKRLHLKLKVIY